ncbi:MAG: C25 family cysteine peptidase [Anaerolineae bacterium]|jgi:hypothetical protein
MSQTDGTQDERNGELIYVNGLNATTGEYLDPPWSLDEASAAALDEKRDAAHDTTLGNKASQEEASYAPEFGFDPRDLGEVGWAVIFAQDADPDIKQALKGLLDHRHQEAGERYREYTLRPGETWQQFSDRHGVGYGPAAPDEMPFYVLIVGDPETIPYRFQYQLDVQRAVGRIYFDRPEEYERYAQSVVQSEEGKVRLPRRATFFGVRNNDDLATERSVEYLIDPLAEELATAGGWTIDNVPQEQALKARLAQLVSGAQTPSLLFTASHGAHFDAERDAERHKLHEGGLICGDWPGRYQWFEAIPPEWYLNAQDVGPEARVWGTIAVFFACFGAGTPRLNDFVHRRELGRPEKLGLSPYATVAPLPRRLLSHPNGGALAVVGHVDRGWDTSFKKLGLSGKEARDLAAFRSLLRALMFGMPVGHAMEYINARYATMSSRLVTRLDDIQHYGEPLDKVKVARLWTANNDARNFVIVGDPAVRLPLPKEGEQAMDERPAMNYTPTQVTPEIGSPAVAAPGSEGGQARAPDVPQAEFGEIDYGLADLFRGKDGEPSALRGFVEKMGETLQKAASEATTLKVRTYVSDDLDAVAYDKEEGFSGATLRALTILHLDGDVVACVPQTEGKIDEALWEVHLQLVERAQSNRNELLRTAVSALTGLVRPGAMS